MSQASLRALRAFAEVAQSGSLAAAARALHVTPSAVSHLLRDLERALGVSLFAARTPSVRLSEAGVRLADGLQGAFAAIDAAVAEARHDVGDVRVSALSSFLTLWLVPRLAGFQARHPRTRLLFSSGIRPVALHSEPFDCAIRWGRGGWPGLAATLLFRDRPVVVVNPRLAAAPAGRTGAGPRRNGAVRGAGTGGEALPRLAARTRPEDWSLVAAALGWADVAPVLTFETRALAVQAAMAGMGAAVVDRNLVAGMLESGVLAEIAPAVPVAVAEGHWFVALPERLRQAPVRRFRDWLVAEVGGVGGTEGAGLSG